MHASYLEIYEGRVYDLLDVSSRGKPVEDREIVSLQSDGDGNEVLKGLISFEVTNEGKRRRGGWERNHRNKPKPLTSRSSLEPFPNEFRVDMRGSPGHPMRPGVYERH